MDDMDRGAVIDTVVSQLQQTMKVIQHDKVKALSPSFHKRIVDDIKKITTFYEFMDDFLKTNEEENAKVTKLSICDFDSVSSNEEKDTNDHSEC